MPLQVPTVPLYTTPLTKFGRTLEGILVVAANLALFIVPIFSSSLSEGNAAKYAAGLDAVTVISRSILKTFTRTPPLPTVVSPQVVERDDAPTHATPSPPPAPVPEVRGEV